MFRSFIGTLAAGVVGVYAYNKMNKGPSDPHDEDNKADDWYVKRDDKTVTVNFDNISTGINRFIKAIETEIEKTPKITVPEIPRDNNDVPPMFDPTMKRRGNKAIISGIPSNAEVTVSKNGAFKTIDIVSLYKSKHCSFFGWHCPTIRRQRQIDVFEENELEFPADVTVNYKR